MAGLGVRHELNPVTRRDAEKTIEAKGQKYYYTRPRRSRGEVDITCPSGG